VKVTFDPEKRVRTLAERGLDMADAAGVFEGRHLTFLDRRQDYGEVRWVTFGDLAGRLLVFAWTPRGDAIRIISLRKANGREEKRYGARLR
jgi:uncharacterized DUF497 family protein